MVEATEFPHLVQKYGVMGVPKTVVNETVTFEGAVPEAHFLSQVLKAVEAPTRAPSESLAGARHRPIG